MALKLKEISLNLPFGIGGATIKLSEAERLAAWSLYVEYSTRVTTQALGPSQGSVREALNSLYKLFEVTRETLKAAGPEVAHGPQSLGPLAIRILNDGVRPFLVQWHTVLSGFEDQQRLDQRKQTGPGIPAVIDESLWSEQKAFYADLQCLQKELVKYVDALALLAGINQIP